MDINTLEAQVKALAAQSEELKERVTNVENRTSAHDTQYAVINTKLSAILWGLGVIATALIGVLFKLVFKV